MIFVWSLLEVIIFAIIFAIIFVLVPSRSHYLRRYLRVVSSRRHYVDIIFAVIFAWSLLEVVIFVVIFVTVALCA